VFAGDAVLTERTGAGEVQFSLFVPVQARAAHNSLDHAIVLKDGTDVPETGVVSAMAECARVGY
jgi:hypothetical protein